ncbi:MAG: hypothetical protein ACXADS_13320 [Candidatus Thorarchaeota archaeon]
MTWVGPYFQYQPSQGSVGLWGYWVNSSSANEATYGITVVNLDGNDVDVIWDRILILTTTADDSRVDINANSELRVTAQLEYDGHGLGSGDTLYMDDVAMTWDGGDTRFELLRTKSTVDLWTYFVNSSSANEATYGITVVNLDSNEQDVIWDRIKILTTTTQDGRIDISTAADLRVTAELEYDSHSLGSGDTLYMNDTSMSWSASYFQLQPNFAIVGLWTFFVNSSSANEVDYGITVVNLDGNDIDQIWDRIKILTTTTEDGRIDYGTAADIRVTAELEYDSHALGASDTLYMNDTSMSWVSTYFQLQPSFSQVGLWTFFVNSSNANEADYGITAVFLDSNEVDEIWDRLTIDIQADDETPLNGVQANFTLTVTYEYDSQTCTTYTIQIDRNATNWFTFTNSNKSLFNDTNSDKVYLFNATGTGDGVSETTYGLTAFVTNTETVTWSAAANEVPVNDTAPVLANPDDTDNMYAKYRFYLITSNVSDQDGYTDILYVELSLWDNGRGTELWRVRYTVSGSSWSVELGSAYITLTYSSVVESGNDIDITWSIKIDWDHNDWTDIDTDQYVYDGTDSDQDWYESDWDTETRLDYSVAPYLSDDRGNINTADLQGDGTVIYYTSVDDYPYANETDVWVLHDVSGTWSDDVDGSGAFTITSIGSSASVRLNTYTFKVVEQAAGSGGTDLYYTTSLTDTFITDQIVVQTTTADDTRVDMSTSSEVRVTLWLDYDNDYLGAGDSVTLDDVAMTWDGGNGWFDLARTQGSVGLWTYFVNSSSDAVYGVTALDVNSQEVDIIWDRIKILTTTTEDGRIDYGTSADIRVTAELEYDSHALGAADTLYMADTLMSWVSTYFQLTPSKSQVGLWNYFVNASSANEDTYGITLVNLDGNNVDEIWDRIKILTTTTQDGRIDYNTQADIRVTAELEYDSHALGAADTLYMNDTSMTWVSTYFRLQPQFASVGLWTFFVNSSSANEADYGITVINLDGNDVDEIWDRIKILTTTADDSRVDINANSELRVTAELEYDSHSLGSGDTLYMNDTSMSWDAGDVRFELLRSQASVGLWKYFVNSSSANEATYGITVVNLDGNEQDVIWDRIKILTTTSQDDRIDISTSADIRVTAELEYDSHTLGSGDTLYMADTLMSWVSSYFQLTPSKAQVGLWNYYVNSSSANEATYGITVINLDSNDVDQIWDRIQVQTTTVDDSRVGINDNVEIRVTLWLDYDDDYLGSGDSVTLDDTAMSWDGGNSWFELTRSQSTVGDWTYFVNSSSDATYGITALDLNSQEQVVIWDRLNIDIQADLETPDNGQQVNFTLTVIFEYDSATCTTYEIAFDREAVYWYTFTNANKSLFNDTQSDVTYNYNASNVNAESTYGILVFTTNTESVTWSPANYAPVNDTAPVLTNPHDTDHLYAWIQYYIITSNVSDQDGYTDILYVELSLYDNARAGEVWKVRYTVIGQAFSVQVGSAYIDLTGSTVDESGNDIDITWSIRIDWDHADLQDIDMKQYVTDDAPETDTDWYESNWEVETRLDIVDLTISEARGKTSRNDLEINGTVIYFESASQLNPTTALVDVWADGPVSDKVDYDLTTGYFIITGVESSATVNLDVYIMKIVPDGEGVGGTNLLHNGHTVTYISDMLKVTLSTSTPNVNIGIEVTIDVEVVYAYDDSAVSSYFADIDRDVLAFITINETDPSFTDVELEDMTHIYTVDGANETLYGLELVSWSNSLTVTWGEGGDIGGSPWDDETTTTTTTTVPYEPPMDRNLLTFIFLASMFTLIYLMRQPKGEYR